MPSRHSYEWWRPDALLPALVVVGPYFFNKLIYIEFPGYPVFVATDYACLIFSLAFLYLLLRNEPTSLPIPWRLSVPSTKELLTALIGTITLISANVVGTTFIRYLEAHSWRATRFPLPTNSALQYFDGTVGMVFVGLSEEVVFRFYLINLQGPRA
jgi:membrane protease YdiL (CAAX protease family)